MKWQKINKILERNDTSVQAHKKELFGSLIVDESPEEFTLISALRKLGMWCVPSDMSDKQIHDLAKAIAHIQLEGIMDIIRRHDDIIERRIQDRSRKAASSKGTK